LSRRAKTGNSFARNAVPGTGKVRYDIAFGGAFYAFVDVEEVRLKIIPEHYRALIDKGMAIKRAVMENDVIQYADLIGDYNPMHRDKKFGRKSPFGKNIVHGMLLTSLFSTLVGMYCPGQRCLYVSQSANFRQPVYFGDELVIRGTIISG